MKNVKVVIFVAIVSMCFLLVVQGNQFYSAWKNKDSFAGMVNYQLMTRLGYTEELLAVVDEVRSAETPTKEQIDAFLTILPSQSHWRYHSHTLQAESPKVIDVYYQEDENKFLLGGNGLDPYRDTVEENGMLLLFAALRDLATVNMHYGNENPDLFTNTIVTYAPEDLNLRFGLSDPFGLNQRELYRALHSNIQTSESYFAHYYRISLEDEQVWVAYRNDEPTDRITREDGSILWIYPELHISHRVTETGEVEESRGAAKYYFKDSAGLYATSYHVTNGESYDDVVTYLGYPGITKKMDESNTYIAYQLREGQNRHAYFIIQDGRVIVEGVMFGDDYDIIDLR